MGKHPIPFPLHRVLGFFGSLEFGTEASTGFDFIFHEKRLVFWRPNRNSFKQKSSKKNCANLKTNDFERASFESQWFGEVEEVGMLLELAG